MATQNDVRRIALALPAVVEHDDRFAFSVVNKDKLKGIVWVWQERIEPKKPRVPNPAVVALRTANLDDKEILLAADPATFFTEPHYNGYPAVLVRLAAITPSRLQPLVEQAWRCQAPKALVKEWEQRAAPTDSRRAAPSARAKKAPAKQAAPQRRAAPPRRRS